MKEDIKDILIAGARAGGICGEGMSRLRYAPNRDSLVEYYVENPDWCMERDFPDYALLERLAGELSGHGVYVGREFSGELLNERQVYIFHGCRGVIRVGLNVERELIPMLYVANGCRLRIVGVGDSEAGDARHQVNVPVYVFGRNDLSVRDNRYVRFNKYRFPKKWK